MAEERVPIPVRMPKEMRLALMRVASREGQGIAAWIRSKIAPHLSDEMEAIRNEKSQKLAPK